MPYNDITDLPVYVRNYSEVIQRQFMYVYNSTHKKVFEETNSDKQAEERAVMAGNSVLKKRFKKSDSREQNTEQDYFQHLIDSFLGNLKG